MAMISDLDRREAALQWLVRTNDAEFDDWSGFTAWLEQDEANADAYHALAASEAEMRPLLIEQETTTEARPVRIDRRVAWGSTAAAIAAALALVIAPNLQPVDYVTAPGETRMVSLGGRDQLVLNGGTKVELGGLWQRTVRIEQGQVLVRLEEPGRSKYAFVSGDLELLDVGTVFEVVRDGNATRVVVSEGAVIADPQGARLQLDGGERLDTEDGATVLEAAPAPRESVGAFAQGHLLYLDEPLDKVAADVRRSTGLDISVDEAIRARRFTGTLSIAELRRDPRALGPLLGVSLQPSGRGWKLQEGA